MIDTVALREKVLDLAIRGKLVPQDPNDEPASVLLERIRTQKQQMVKEGKLKAKDIKDDSIIFVGEDNLHYEKFADGTVECIEDKIPFELPDGWLWTRLGSISSAIQYGLSNSAEQIGTQRLLRITDIQDGKVNWDTVPFTTVRDPEPYLLMKGDIVFARTGATVGKSFLIEETPYPAVYASYLIRIRLIEGVLPEYIYQFFNSQCYWNQITDKSVGVGQPNCNGTSLKELLIPLPPANEQSKIVPSSRSAIEFVIDIENQKNYLLEDISTIKSKILDLAIRGKLVPQNPDDEPASVLLERIRAEKEELIIQGKIKRDKKESVIFKGEDNSYYEKIGEKVICIDDELPFEIPESWSWTRFGNIVFNYDSQRRPITKHNRVNDLGLYDYYGATGAIDKVDSYIFDGEYLMIGEDGGNFFTQRDNSFIASGRFWANNHVHIVQPVVCDIWYLKHFLDSCDLALMGLITGIGVPKLNQENMNKILVPIPPIEEQDRIAFKVKEIYSVLSNVEKSLD